MFLILVVGENSFEPRQLGTFVLVCRLNLQMMSDRGKGRTKVRFVERLEATRDRVGLNIIKIVLNITKSYYIILNLVKSCLEWYYL